MKARWRQNGISLSCTDDRYRVTATSCLVVMEIAIRTKNSCPVCARARRFASASALRNLLEQVEPSEIPSLVVTIGPIASAEAARWGLKVAAEADPHTVEGLIEATVQAATARTATAQAATLRAQTEHS